MGSDKPWERSKAVRLTPGRSGPAHRPEQPGSAGPFSGADPEAEIWSRLSPVSKDVLRCLLTRFGVHPAEEERLLEEAAAGCWSGLELRAGLSGLQAAGAVQARLRFWGERAVAVTAGSYLNWAAVACPWTSAEEKLARRSAASAVSGGGALYSRALLGALAELARSGPVLTVKGKLHRGTVKALEQAAGLNPESFIRLDPSLRLDYPGSVALVLDWSFSSGILRPGAAWSWDVQKLRTWLDEPLMERERRLFRWILDRAVRHSAEAAAAASVVSSLREDVWYSVPRLELLCRSRFGWPAGRPGRDSPAHAGLLEWLAGCGWAEWGETEQGKSCFRLLLSAEGREEEDSDGDEPLLLQPDGDIWAGAWTSYRQLWPLELAAERGEVRELTAYRLTEKSLKRAAALGIGAGQLREWLSGASGMALPPPVETLLAQGLPGTGSRSALFAVEESGEEAAGLAGRPSWQSSDPSLTFAALEPAPPAEVQPGLVLQAEKLPAAWTGVPRSYRPSTCRQLLESAVRLHIPVELHDGESAGIFVPLQVQGDGDGWAAEGFYRKDNEARVPAMLIPGQVGRIRLLMPGNAAAR
ncbi:hypothetical protein SAMN05880570_1039 [Paenibacillus sp. RU4T]|nr:hypothetical protein SAMN05880555_1040 [Paenibacillus sp. RU4X]SIQ43341.1 hypothetical protein SAMN05880570_1039 [Paenibacillus sp. RU4T]